MSACVVRRRQGRPIANAHVRIAAKQPWIENENKIWSKHKHAGRKERETKRERERRTGRAKERRVR